MPGLQQHQLSEQHAASTMGGQEQDRCIDLTGDSDSDADRRVVSDPRLKQQQRAHRNDAIVIDEDEDDDVVIMDSMPGPQHSLERKAQLGSARQHSGAQGRQSCEAAAAALTGGSPAMGTAAASQGQPPQNISSPVPAAPADGSQQPAKKLRLDFTSGQQLPEPQQQQQQQQQQQLPRQLSAPSSGSQPLSGQALSRQQRLTQALSQSRAGSAGTNGAASTATTKAQAHAAAASAAAGCEPQSEAQATAARPAVKQGRKQAASRLGSAPMPPVLLPPAQHPVPAQPAASAPVRPAAAAMPAIRTHVTPAAAAPTALTTTSEQPEVQQPAAKVSKTSPVWSDSRRAATPPARAEAQPQQLSNNDGGLGNDAGG
jgi:hypothetical protein